MTEQPTGTDLVRTWLDQAARGEQAPGLGDAPCEAGRVVHADIRGWDRPCPELSTRYVIVSDEIELPEEFEVADALTDALWLAFCDVHAHDFLTRAGWEDIAGAPPVQNVYLPGDAPEAEG